MHIGELVDEKRIFEMRNGAVAVTENDNRTKDRQIRADPSARPEASVDSAFDSWLTGRLQEMFGDAAHEPIPHEMLDLLESKSERE